MFEAQRPEAVDHPLRHVAIIMDGNSRWARARGWAAIAGHRAGVERVRDVLDSCLQHGIEVATLFAFSSENWQRSGEEVSGLMALFATYLRKERPELVRRDVSLRVIGARDRFSPRLRRLIERVEEATAGGRLRLNLAVDYGGRWDIVRAARELAEQARAGRVDPADIDEAAVERHLCLADGPPPDLCIRTAGELRISNFLLWQLAYTELYFADCFWPDFDAARFSAAVAEYHRRQRRFGRSAAMALESTQCSGSA
ncbi:MAG: polyprenyl diphosphate synthase [Pseudomonadota bacterium]